MWNLIIYAREPDHHISLTEQVSTEESTLAKGKTTVCLRVAYALSDRRIVQKCIKHTYKLDTGDIALTFER